MGTHPRIFKTPTPLELALGQVNAWLESPSLVVLSKHNVCWPELRDFVLAARIAGARVHDARIAALCTSHGVGELWTADRDFSWFPGIAARNPLVG